MTTKERIERAEATLAERKRELILCQQQFVQARAALKTAEEDHASAVRELDMLLRRERREEADLVPSA
jgi:hypothetical protein